MEPGRRAPGEQLLEADVLRRQFEVGHPVLAEAQALGHGYLVEPVLLAREFQELPELVRLDERVYGRHGVSRYSANRNLALFWLYCE